MSSGDNVNDFDASEIDDLTLSQVCDALEAIESEGNLFVTDFATEEINDMTLGIEGGVCVCE